MNLRLAAWGLAMHVYWLGGTLPCIVYRFFILTHQSEWWADSDAPTWDTGERSLHHPFTDMPGIGLLCKVGIALLRAPKQEVSTPAPPCQTFAASRFFSIQVFGIRVDLEVFPTPKKGSLPATVVSRKLLCRTQELLPDCCRKSNVFKICSSPFLAPYFVYVAISSIPAAVVPADAGQVVKLVATALTLLWYRKFYRFGHLKLSNGFVALMALPAALVCWIAPFYLLSTAGIIDLNRMGAYGTISSLYFGTRMVNSVILVAIFEELFIRVYVMSLFYQAGREQQENGMIGSILDTLDCKPLQECTLPLSLFSVVGATLVFTAGHHPYEYLSAILYFLFTTWIYKKTKSLWVCIIIHGLTNLAIGLLVGFGGMAWLWG